MLATDRIKEELQAAFPNAALHPMDCDCGHCRLTNPIAARRERIVRTQAAVLGTLLVLLYAMALFLAPQIIAAFRAPAPDLAISSGAR